MKSAPKVIRTDFVGAPVLGLNYGAYVSFSSPYSIKEAKNTQRLSGSNLPPNGKSNFSTEIYR
jgi:hypothetical protein